MFNVFLFDLKGVLFMKKVIINIDKEYGCGGRNIAKLLSEKYNIAFWDKDITERASRKSGIKLDIFQKVEQQQTNSFLYSLTMGAYNYGDTVTPAGTVSMSERIYLVTSETIKEIADEGSAVIIGRCANYILRGRPECVNVFVYCNFDDRVEHIMKRENVSESKARSLIAKSDKKRNSYLKYYIQQEENTINKYNDLIINTSSVGVDGAVKLIEQLVSVKQSRLVE